FNYTGDKSEVNRMKTIFRQPPVVPAEGTLIPETKDSLLEDLKKTRFALEVAYSGFDNVTDPDLIDCYIYQVNSIWKRYSYLIAKISRS
ncbi:MAG: YaaL family protein, partial [Lachnospiraceae bacterium]|nr:YaaL family protein [Lachnospiraceae bacterium]